MKYRILFVFILQGILILNLSAQKQDLENSDMIFIKGEKNKQSFYIDQCEVSMLDFYNFVQATGYTTEIERDSNLRRNLSHKKSNWRQNDEGNYINIKSYDQHPVTMLTINDMQAYAQWAGKEIPTYNQWKRALLSVSDNKFNLEKRKGNNCFKNKIGELVYNHRFHQFGEFEYVVIGGYVKKGEKFLRKKWLLHKDYLVYLNNCIPDYKVILQPYFGFRCVINNEDL